MIAGAERLAVDVADAQALKARAVSGDPEALRAAARQFESLLVAQMLKTMRETRFSEEDDPMTGGDGVKLYRELLDQQWAAKISNGRGLGFAEMMVKAMEGRGSGVVSASALTNPASSPSEGSGVVSASALTNPAPPFSGGMATAPASAAAAINPTAGSPDAAQRNPGPLMGPTVGWQSPADAEPVGRAALRPHAERSPDSAALHPGYTAPAGNRKQAFLETMQPHAEAAAAATGVPARFILAQAALESGWGQREVRGENGAASHNLFGIKAGSNWAGGTVETLTTEYRQGLPMKSSQTFRAYDDYSAGFTDYANLLKSRYGAALAAGTDSTAFADGIAAGGYATDPAYAAKLKSVIASVAMAGG